MSIFKAISNAMTPTLRVVLLIVGLFIAAALISTLFGCATPYQPPCSDCWMAL